jgi:hypothetical protein
MYICFLIQICMLNLEKFTNENQDPIAIEKLAKKLNDLMTPGEELEYIAVQKKPAVNISPDGVAITNKRLIFCRQKNLGLSMDFEDFFWKNVFSCSMKESLLGADFFAKTVDNRDFSIDYLPKAQARKLYAIANEYKENARQEPQAASPKIETTPAPEPTMAPVVEEQDKIAETLQKLKKLYESGLITQQEFENKKNEIINSL